VVWGWSYAKLKWRPSAASARVTAAINIIVKTTEHQRMRTSLAGIGFEPQSRSLFGGLLCLQLKTGAIIKSG
jgi:hypothetical protein